MLTHPRRTHSYPLVWCAHLNAHARTQGPRRCRYYQSSLSWYTERSLTDNKPKSTHRLLSSVCLLLILQTSSSPLQPTACVLHNRLVPGLPPPADPKLPRTCKNTVDTICPPMTWTSGDAMICIPLRVPIRFMRVCSLSVASV